MKTLSEKIKEALAVIEQVDFDAAEPGKHVVNDDFFYLVQSYETKAPEAGRHEAHKKYVDIQYLVEGKERIDLAPAEKMDVEEAYDEERDVVFFKEPSQATTVVLTGGGYAILYPEDSHKPGLSADGAVPVKKIVGKVRI